MTIGTVKFFNAVKGFGFIIPEDGGKDVFVHKSALELAGIPTLIEGQCLSYETESDAAGAIKAAILKQLSKESAPSVTTESSMIPSSNEIIPIRRANHNQDRRAPRSNSPSKVRTPDQTNLGRNLKAPNKSTEWRRSYDRYCDLAQGAGNDSMMREHYWQHAEHFLRMMNGSST